MKQTPMYRPSTGPNNSGLTRYGSAPGSLLTSIADSVINEAGGVSGFHSGVGPRPGPESAPGTHSMTRFFTQSCHSSTESSCGPGGVHRPAGLPVGEISGAAADSCGNHGAAAAEVPAPAAGGGGGGSGPHLMRHSSSPAGFFSQLLVDNNGFPVSRGMGHYSQPPSNGVQTMPHTRVKSQLSFSRQELSQISEIGIPEMGDSVVGGNSSDENGGNVGQSYISSNYSMGSWDDTNSIAFSTPNKRARDNGDDLLTSFSHIDSQFSLPTTSLEMAAVEKLLQAQQDSVPFKVRAKRGCATHPRSIAERERRTRISEKLRKLQELVPNMDKQTSTADMLDLAVQHIKELQRQVQDLNQEQANCTCKCKEEHS